MLIRQRRSFDQCMADALDNLTSSTGAGGGKPFADICVVAHVDDATGELIAELPDGERLPKAVLEQLSCNAKLTGAVYDRKGKPIWRTQSRRTVTEAQWQLLIAKWGGCFHCGANPGICQGHHIEPASRGGPTKLDNLVPACWSCHHRIHHHNWQIHKHPDGWHTLHPPDRMSYGPAHAPEAPPIFKPATNTPSRAGPAPTRRADTTHPASIQTPTPAPAPPRHDDDSPFATTPTQSPTPGPAPSRRVSNRPQNPHHEPLFTLI
ncbi:MAG: HNH endonuclease [Acidimicrobiaceae bacterium]|nr:HNH endonuclease [Acidimicrobiaceae bacterium]